MLARFFIDRPILAWVISIVIVTLGLIAYRFLPIAQYPQITPPVVRVSANYPGASAAVVAETLIARLDLNIFVQVGFVVLVGLAAKNAILVVEFARDREVEGATPYDAAVEAATVRLRPIIMTSFAFVLGMVPLVLATGPRRK